MFAEKADVIRVKGLTRILNEACHAYYMQGKEIMNDRQYDDLLDELKRLEEETGFRLANSPTQKVGSPVVSRLAKVTHRIPLYSLDKTKEIDRLRKFVGWYPVIVSPKLDGLTLAALYAEGKLAVLSTRGDGEVGEDVTHNAIAILNLPQIIPYKKDLFVVGEGVVGFSDFKKINQTLSPESRYSNPRNLAAGSVRQLDCAVAAKRHIQFFAFRAVPFLEKEKFSRKSDVLIWLKQLGFDVVDHVMADRDSIASVVKSFEEALSSSDIPTDGLVITIDDLAVSESLGVTSKYPRDSLAFKWHDELVKTTLLEVVWQTGRTGVITPVAFFEEVDLDGKKVTRATLHNVSVLRQLQLGLGDSIGVYNANMVIPQVGENYTRSDNCVIPDICPECGQPARLRRSEEVEILFCTNEECPARLVQRLKHFVSRDALNIEGLSTQTLEKFVEKEFIRDLPDIFLLPTYRDEIVALPGFGEKSFDNLVESIDRARSVELYRFIYALGIKYVGRIASKALCEHFNNDLNSIMFASLEQLQKVEGFGEKLAASVYEFFRDKQNLSLVNELLSHVGFRENKNSTFTGKLAGKVIVVTGKVEQFENRAAIQAFIEQNGGIFGTAVTQKTDYLVTNDPFSGSTKNRKAKGLGVKVITEQELIDMVGR